MRAGFYEVDITPHLGSVIPGDFAPRYADGILHKLYSRAAGDKIVAAFAEIFKSIKSE